MQNSSTKQTQEGEIVCYLKAFANTKPFDILDENPFMPDAEDGG